MEEIDFLEENRCFRHPDTKCLIEFPPGPLGIGEEQVRQIIDLKTRTGTVRIISPTEERDESVVGLVWATADGGIGGAIVAWLYNLIVSRTSTREA